MYTLGDNLRHLLDNFAANAGSVRILLLTSPT